MFRASLIYLSSSILSKSVPFLLLPFLTNKLNPAEFGLVAIFQLMIQFGQAGFGMCMQSNIPGNYFSKEKSEVSVLIFNIFLLLILSCTVFMITVGLYSVCFGELFGVPRRWILAMPILTFMGMANLISLTYLRTSEQPFLFSLFESGHAVTSFIITLFFLFFVFQSWEARAIGIAIPLALFAIIGLYNLHQQGFLVAKYSAAWIKEIFFVSIPLMPHAIAGVVITLSDRLFIEKMVGISAVGVYSVGYYFGMVVMLFSDAFVKAWSPWFFKLMNADIDSNRARIVKYTYIYAFILLAGAMLYSFAAVIALPLVVSEQFLSATKYIPWVSFAYVFFGIYQVFFPYLVYSKRTKVVGVATVSAACINLIGNYFLIGMYGAIGAAYSTVIAFFVSALILIKFSTSIVSMPWHLWK